MDAKSLESFLAERRNIIVAGIRKDGRPHVTTNYFYWDGSLFYVPITHTKVKYTIFRNDPRVQLLIDDDPEHRTVSLYGTVEVREDLALNLSRYRAIFERYGQYLPDTEEELLTLMAKQDRALLAITPDGPMDTWTTQVRFKLQQEISQVDGGGAASVIEEFDTFDDARIAADERWGSSSGTIRRQVISDSVTTLVSTREEDGIWGPLINPLRADGQLPPSRRS